jgi:hypothetical protein
MTNQTQQYRDYIREVSETHTLEDVFLTLKSDDDQMSLVYLIETYLQEIAE